LFRANSLESSSIEPNIVNISGFYIMKAALILQV
jgi:hypothetical protein